MRKLIFAALAAMMTFGQASAQEKYALSGTSFGDNWSIGIQGGGIVPMMNYEWVPNTRALVGLTIDKQFNPVYGMSLENNWGINTSSWQADMFGTTKSGSAFDYISVMLLHRLNLNNVFSHWNGKRSVFEVEAVGGAGFLRYNYNSAAGSDKNTLAVKAGVNFNFNLGKERAWTLAVKPAVVWDALDYQNQDHMKLNGNRCTFELLAGITYHFGAGNGKHYQTRVRLYDEEEAANMRRAIEAMTNAKNRAEADALNAQRALAGANSEIARLKKALEDCENSKVPAKSTMQTLVSFRQGKCTIDATQRANVEQMANYMQANPGSTVVVTGFASPEGGAKFNQRLSERRAEAVKNMLVKKYNIAADRIETRGKGVGSVFSEGTMNRVSICIAD